MDPSSDETRVCKDMAKRCRRTQSFDDHFGILVLSSVGAFARLCLLNDDSFAKIGPLVDLVPGPASDGSTVVLANYIQVFGAVPTSYLSRLGRAIQMYVAHYPSRSNI